MSRIERHDLQGFIMSGYAKMHYATYLLLAIRDVLTAQSWLAELASRITTGEKPEENRCLNVAFTHAGLRAIGVDARDLKTFAPPFQEGMAAPHRKMILGDTGASEAKNWLWGGPNNPEVHVLLLMFAKDTNTFAAVEAHERERLSAAGLDVIYECSPEPLPGSVSFGKFGVEHFGFADGMSQPVIKGSGQDKSLAGDDARRSVIEAGEFILGYPNGYNKLTPWPKLATLSGGSNFGRNGTYLVFRHLSQDVAGFWRFLDAHAQGDAYERERLGAKVVGRWPSGAPLVRAHHRDDPDLSTDNSFGYAAWDPQGLRCPIASHIRRTNPRDSIGTNPKTALELTNLHRILRRGRVYGPGLKDPLAGDDGCDRGLFFICLNANIERQFEFIQHTWCNNPQFGGRYDEQDPLIGNSEGNGNFSIQDTPVRQRLTGLPSFVTTRGGAYFFLPGIQALRQLSILPVSSSA
jgi:Dyp-type peroxidase family